MSHKLTPGGVTSDLEGQFVPKQLELPLQMSNEPHLRVIDNDMEYEYEPAWPVIETLNHLMVSALRGELRAVAYAGISVRPGDIESYSSTGFKITDGMSTWEVMGSVDYLKHRLIKESVEGS